jgi:hypothetical protein
VPVLLAYETLHAIACAGEKQVALSLTGSLGLSFRDQLVNPIARGSLSTSSCEVLRRAATRLPRSSDRAFVILDAGLTDLRGDTSARLAPQFA